MSDRVGTEVVRCDGGDAIAGSANPHIDQQGPPYDWTAYRTGERTFVVYDVPEGLSELYVASAASINVRTFAHADAALYQGELVGTHYDEDTGLVEFCHTWGGKIDSRHVEEWLDEPAIRLKRLPSNGAEAFEEMVA